MITHIVLLKYKAGLSPEDIKASCELMRSMQHIPVVKNVWVNEAIASEKAVYQSVMRVEFENEADHAAYLEHPKARAMFKKHDEEYLTSVADLAVITYK